LVGLNVNTDREFGVALLNFLGAQLRSRADAAKQFGVAKLAELREEDPAGRWPRIVAVIDEFQVLFSGRDALTNQAVELLEDLARRGRSQGIHLVLASQDVSGIEALWGRSALLAQLTLRVALPKARRILAETNPAADEIPRYHAVVNTDSGVPSANRIVRIPDASDRGTWNELLTELTNRWGPANARPAGPRVFDGDAVPLLDDARDFIALRPPAAAAVPEPGTGPGSGPWATGPGSPAVPVALLGAAVDVTARSIAVPLGRSPGRNLAVLGTAAPAARSILDAAARSLNRQYRPGEARFSVALLGGEPGAEPSASGETAGGTAGGDETAGRGQPAGRGTQGVFLGEHASALRAALPPATGWYGAADLTELLRDALAQLERPNPAPHFLLLYAVDAAAGELAVRGPAGTGHELLRRLLHLGPERNTHVLGWWRAVQRLRDDLGGITARFDAVGAWVALDIHGSELTPLAPAGAPPWYPRPWRALFYDRSRHRSGEVLIPYRETR
jgi:hypothetical protein